MMKILFFIRQLNIMILLTMGVSLEYICGDFDLAFAAQISASSLLGVFLLMKGTPLILSFLVVFSFNALIGCLKGFFIVKFQMPSVIVTLGLQIILVNLCAGITENKSLVFVELNRMYRKFPIKEIGLFLTIAGMGAVYYFLEHTYYGKYCRILGENLPLARQNGLKCVEISVLIHIVVSVFFAIPTILLMFYTGSGGSFLGADYLYKVLTATVLGQHMIRKKRNDIWGMIAGALIVVLFTCVLTVYGALNRWENILMGIVILICISEKYKKV